MFCLPWNKLSNIFHTWLGKCHCCMRCWLLLPHLSNVCWRPWAPLRRFSSSEICFGGSWGFWQLFCVLAWAEACSGAPQRFLCRGATWDRLPVWVPWRSLDILHILGRGRRFPQLIHTEKCWDEKRDQILFPLQARRATASDPPHKKGVGQGRDPQAAPSLGGSAVDSAAGQASAICQGKGTTHSLVLLLSWCRPDFKHSLNLLNRKIQTTSDIPFLENYFGKYDSFTSLLNRRSNIFQHSLRMHLTRS